MNYQWHKLLHKLFDLDYQADPPPPYFWLGGDAEPRQAPPAPPAIGRALPSGPPVRFTHQGP
jgi:hypothetical protein